MVFFGFTPNPGPEANTLDRLDSGRFPATTIAGRPAAAAAEAFTAIPAAASEFVIHLDIDVVDFADLPLADIPQAHAGLTLADTMRALEVFVAGRRCGGLTLTEVNPDRGDRGGNDLRRLIDALGAALQPLTHLETAAPR